MIEPTATPVSGAKGVLPAPLLGDLLSYPEAGYFDRLLSGYEQLIGTFPDVAKEVGRFRDAVRKMDLGELEEHYTKTFDLSPECVPYVGMHAFGEQENKRRWFLCGLADRYNAAGFVSGSPELPDHIAIILKAFPYLSTDEQRDLIRLCLGEAVQKMVKSLEKTDSPYMDLMQAVVLYVQQEPSENIP